MIVNKIVHIQMTLTIILVFYYYFIQIYFNKFYFYKLVTMNSYSN